VQQAGQVFVRAPAGDTSAADGATPSMKDILMEDPTIKKRMAAVKRMAKEEQ
jgi:hypothetical protein